MTIETIAARLEVTPAELEANLSAIVPAMTRLMASGMAPDAAMAAAFAERQAMMKEMVEGKTERSKAARKQILDNVYEACRAA